MTEKYLGPAFDDYCDKWEKAQEDGIFDDASGPASPTPQTAEVDFFGQTSTNPTENPDHNDIAYWDAIYRASGHTGDPEPGDVGYEGEIPSASDPEPSSHGGMLTEGKRKEYPPNPVRMDTGGSDQDLSPQSLGQTFDEEDIKALEDMRLKLHELESKVAAAMSSGASDKSFKSKIGSLKSKIDELSTQMCHSYPTDIG